MPYEQDEPHLTAVPDLPPESEPAMTRPMADTRAAKVVAHVTADPAALVTAAIAYFIGCASRADRGQADAFTGGRREGYIQAIAFLTGLSHREVVDGLRSGELHP